MSTEKSWVILMRESVLTQSFITLLLIVTACVLWIMRVELPQTLEYLLVTVIGFFFGTKITYQVMKGMLK